MSDPVASILRHVDDLAAEDLSLLTPTEFLQRMLWILELQWAVQLEPPAAVPTFGGLGCERPKAMYHA